MKLLPIVFAMLCLNACAMMEEPGYAPPSEAPTETSTPESNPEPYPEPAAKPKPAHVPVFPMPPAEANALWHYITRQNPYKPTPKANEPSTSGGWNKFPGLEKESYPYRADEQPHGDWVGVYANQMAYDSIKTPSSPFNMAYGSILIKENYKPLSDPSLPPPHKNLVSLTVMYKVRGYQTHVGEEEWFWAMFACKDGDCNGDIATIGTQPWVNEEILGGGGTRYSFFNGEVQAGKPWFCLSCHKTAATPEGGGGKAYGDYVWQVIPFHPKN